MNARDKIAEAISRRDTGFPLDARSGLDRAALADVAEAVVAAIRAMSPEEQAELIGGETLTPAAGLTRVIGPWVEVES